MRNTKQCKTPTQKKRILLASLLLIGMCGVLIAIHLWQHAPVEPQTLSELLDLPEDKLARVDIARMNLLCATGLPITGAGNCCRDKQNLGKGGWKWY
jgi:hypothetical protein